MTDTGPRAPRGSRHRRDRSDRLRGSTLLIWIGVAVWGLVNGVLDSTVKAVVTELVSSASRAIAFGWLTFVRGCSLLIAGATLGAAYSSSITLAITVVIAANIIGFVGLLDLRRLPQYTPGR
jgi:Mg2+/Co2+ transporter CorB